MDLSGIFVHLHSGIRWIALTALVIAVAASLFGVINKNGIRRKQLYSTAVYALHLQLLIGVLLFFLSAKVQFTEGFMKDSLLRFFAIEHPLMMVIGVVLVTIGYSKAKRLDDPVQKSKKILIFYTLGLLIILYGIPWPWQAYAAAWG